MKYKISVVIPIFNMEKYLAKCLDSILSQTLKEIEIICVNDGSTDKSEEILQYYANNFESIFIISQLNQGAGTARNKGIQYAHGEYICFMDSDDYYYSNNALETLYNKAKEFNILVCGGRIKKIKEDNSFANNFNIDDYEFKGWVNYIDYQKCYYYTKYIFKTQFLLQNQIKFPEYRHYEDPPFLTLAMITAKKFYMIDETIYVYRTVYKDLDFSANITVDLLNGIKDVLKLALNNNLIRLKYFCIKEVTETYYIPIFKAIHNRDIQVLSVIEKINQILPSNERNHDSILSVQEVDDYYKYCIEERQKVLLICKQYKKVLIYGAGRMGEDLLNFLERYDNIKLLGYAVTDMKGNPNKKGKYTVRNIQNYKNDNNNILVLVTGLEKTQTAMLKKLEEYKYPNVYKINYRDFYFYKEL